ncbi:protein HIDE1 isoform X2 [Peromyscus leucopus]|uniref:protein HIDE1 isoform X2 n=1 Tax=Peromyscus leucopus TaxID=10041 RepID=UPI0010A170F0|nr:protein HIDE1 isoform X2 [Peromyscus leucopus]
MGGEMPWTILLFASGSFAIPAPAIFLVPPYPSSQDDAIYISCTAPEDFLGANFTLFRGEEAVQRLQAPADQPGVTFNVTRGGSEAAGGDFRCQYGVMGEHSQPQLSGLSQSVQVSFPVPTWIMVLSLSLAGAVLLLLAGMVAIAVVVRKAKMKKLTEAKVSPSRVSLSTSLAGQTLGRPSSPKVFSGERADRCMEHELFIEHCYVSGCSKTNAHHFLPEVQMNPIFQM